MKLIITKNKGDEPCIYDGTNVVPYRTILEADSIFAEYYSGDKAKEENPYDSRMWIKMLNNHTFKHEYMNDKEYMLRELVQSYVDVPTEILQLVIEDGRMKGLYGNLNSILPFCNNKSSLRYLLSLGCNFTKRRGFGNSTMEKFFMDTKFFDVIADFPTAVDKRYIRKHKHIAATFFAKYIKEGREKEATLLMHMMLNI